MLLERVLKYLKGTARLSLLHENMSNSKTIDVYVEADFGENKFTHKSTFGFIIRSFGNPVE